MKRSYGPCVNCGATYHPSAMDFHHRDPSTKLFTIGAQLTRSKEAILAEIEKCDLWCVVCHRMQTAGVL